MTAEERTAQLQTENALLPTLLAMTQEQMILLTQRLKALEVRMAKDSRNSSNPLEGSNPARKIAGAVIECRQVHNLHYQQVSCEAYPSEVSIPAHYGPLVRTLAV